MTQFIFQYPAKVEPLAAALDLPLFDWWQPTSQPLYPAPELVQEGLVIEALDPAGFPVPDMSTWWMPASFPVFPDPVIVQEGVFVKPLVEDDFSPVPLMSTWFMPASIPVFPIPAPVNEGYFTKPLDPSGFAFYIVAPDATWAGVGNPPMILVKNVTSSSNPITVVGVLGQTFDGDVSFVMTRPYESWWLISNGSNYMKFFATPGSAYRATNRLTTDTTIDDTFDLVFCDTSGGAFTITLPPVTIDGKMFTFKMVGSTNLLTLDGDGVQLLDDALTATVAGPYNSINVTAELSTLKWWLS